MGSDQFCDLYGNHASSSARLDDRPQGRACCTRPLAHYISERRCRDPFGPRTTFLQSEPPLRAQEAGAL